jgi:hypothetical protein
VDGIVRYRGVMVSVGKQTAGREREEEGSARGRGCRIGSAWWQSEHLVPVNREAAGYGRGLADAALGLAAEPLERALVIADVWLELLITNAVVVLYESSGISINDSETPAAAQTLSHCFSSLESMLSLTIFACIGTHVKRSKPSHMSPPNSRFVLTLRTARADSIRMPHFSGRSDKDTGQHHRCEFRKMGC